MPMYLMNKLVHSCSLHYHVLHLQGTVQRDCQVSHIHMALIYLTPASRRAPFTEELCKASPNQNHVTQICG